MSAVNNIATDLFYKIRSRFAGLKLGNELGEVTMNPEEARFFDFGYTEGENSIGHISVSLAEQGSMKVYFSSGITEGMDESQKTNWYGFLKELRHFAKRRLLSFDTRDITKDNLGQRDYEFLSQYAKQNTIGESTMNESSLYGTRNQSFQKLLDTRLVIKHSKKLTDDQVENSAARTRNISALFVENDQGERFKYPYVHLAGARAMQRHVANGGVPFDEIGESIVEMSEQISQLKQFSNYVARNGLMNEQTQGIVDKGTQHLHSLKEQMKKLSKQKNYEAYVENFEKHNREDVPETVKQDLKNKFTVYNFKEELENVFPVLYRLMKEDELVGYDDIVAMTTENTEQSETEQDDPLREFEEWAMQLGEESAILSTDEEEKQTAVRELQDLVDEHFPAGVNGTNAIQALEDVIDDPDLFRQIKEIAKEDPDQDVRSVVKDWLENNTSDVISELDFGDMVEEEKDEDDEPPFDADEKSTDTDEFGNPIKKKNVAKHLAKKGMRKAMSKQELSEVADYIMSFYDKERGTFPKGPTAVMQSVEKKFGETAGQAAEKMIERMAPQQDGDTVEEGMYDGKSREELLKMKAEAEAWFKKNPGGIGSVADNTADFLRDTEQMQMQQHLDSINDALAKLGEDVDLDEATRREFLDLLAKAGIGAAAAGVGAGIGAMKAGTLSQRMGDDDESDISIKPRPYPDPEFVEVLVKAVNEKGYDETLKIIKTTDMFKNDPRKFQDYKDALDKKLGMSEELDSLTKLAGL